MIPHKAVIKRRDKTNNGVVDGVRRLVLGNGAACCANFNLPARGIEITGASSVNGGNVGPLTLRCAMMTVGSWLGNTTLTAEMSSWRL